MTPVPATRTLRDGLLLGVVFACIVLALVALDRRFFLDDYPPDIRSVVGDAAGSPSDLLIMVAFVLVFGTLLGGPLLSLRAARRERKSPLGFLPAFLHVAGLIVLVNVVDVVVTDWLVFCTLRPAFIVFPGTEGLPGYDDFFFHFKASFLELPSYLLTIGIAALVAGAFTLLDRRRPRPA
ncbi:hypothetical protein [Chondromyces crocatus]|uniref:Uncharacterized protein n=1 Tax=Chondromyces crocatus TaxID=52 RepID=A0A0K1E8C9_CHOCO|nr:hypothetical protein [Chondromyces crocatus]AKT37110.1 uncharacterized protein CMC5_012380 [Chondromyces crocatus]